ncbi:MAG: CvpA family protein [Candidatus Saganbacteria bacterium]|nr:CvpA family protein [Candidatus Saganbacteria bacterium]
MLDVFVGIAIFLFIILGFREGLFKSLTSVAVVFAALFLGTAAVSFLAKGAESFKDPRSLGAVIVFFLVWIVAYILIDLLLTLLFKKAINITILGPVDKVGGVLSGGFKGLLICGIVLQLALALPIADTSKRSITTSTLSRCSIAVYHLSYPYAKKAVPLLSNWLKQSPVDKAGQEHGLEQTAKELEQLDPGQIMDNVVKYDKTAKEQERKIKQLLKDQKLLHDAPVKRIEEVE